MANNRMFIACKNCQEYTGLTKKFQYWIPEKSGEIFEEFLRCHAFCGDDMLFIFEESSPEYEALLKYYEYVGGECTT